MWKKLMEKINNFIATIGADKVMHFAIGGWVVSMFSPFRVLGMTLAYILLLVVSILKEKYLDAYADNKDIVAAMIGGTISYVIGLLFVFA